MNSEAQLINSRYRLGDEIGRGGMGVVFRGWDNLLQRDVAIKVLNQEYLGSGGTERLLDEARVVARLDHPNIVTVFDAGQFGDRPFIVMQFIEGISLAEAQSLEMQEICYLAIQICAALAHAHESGIVHRDLKPENIFLIRSAEIGTESRLGVARVKIVDFGIAHSELANLTIQGEIAGTVSYMAPEQALGEETSPQTDLYALGVILYELTTGVLPFVGDNPLSVISQHINSPVVPPSTLKPELSPEMEQLIISLMKKNPDDRLSSAREVMRQLQDLFSPEEKNLLASIPHAGAKAPEHNLPTQITSFIGRGGEIREVQRLLQEDSCRLLTLVGPGGIGKTRLAIEVAKQDLRKYPEGIYFIPLASISEPDQIVPAIAGAMNFSFDTHASTLDPFSQLVDFIEKRNSLLVLDNYEHLIDGTAIVGDLLGQTLNVKLLITSRERLNLQGEWTFNVHGLEYPENGGLAGEAAGSAVELFIERARLADSGYSLRDEERGDVVRICQLVEGVPLGIELASAWTSMLSSKEIAEEIEKNLDFLTTSMQDLPEKHRSVRAAFNHSWQLLTEQQRKHFSQLSIFRGGFQRQAAQEITDAGLPELSALMDKSLLQRDKNGRFHLHELLRQYAQEQLRKDEHEYSKTRTKHSRFYIKFLNEREEALSGEHQREARDDIRTELDNILGALRWGMQTEEEDVIRSAFATLANFYSLQSYHEAVGTYQDLAEYIKNAAPRAGDRGKQYRPLYLSAMAIQAGFLSMLGAHQASDEIVEQILNDVIDLELEFEHFVCQKNLGVNASLRGENEKAEQYLVKALQRVKALNDEVQVVVTQIWLGWAYYELGRYDPARQVWEEAYGISSMLGNRLLMAFVQSKLALIADQIGDYESAVKAQLKAREHFMYFDDQAGIGYATSRMSLSLINMGEFGEAKRFGGESYQRFAEINHRWGIPSSLCRIGFAEIGLEEYQSAWGNFQEALQLAQQSQILSLVPYALIGIGMLVIRMGDLELGVRMLSFVIAHPGTHPLYKEIALKELAEVESKLSKQDFSEAKERGEASDPERIFSLIPEEWRDPQSA